MKQLVGIHGTYTGHTFTLTHTPFMFGREAANTVQLRSEHVSRHHALIVRRGENYVLIDLNSLNGVVVNDTPIKDEQVLRAGDLIVIENHIFRFEAGSAVSVVQKSEASAAPAAVEQARQVNGSVRSPVGVTCPQCQRVIDLGHQHCPWDGTLLANGHTPVQRSNKHG